MPTKEKIVYIWGAWDVTYGPPGLKEGTSTLRVTIPAGLSRAAAVEHVIDTINREARRWFAHECVGHVRDE